MANATYVKTIAELERMNNSANGNPRFLVKFTDGTEASTQVDAAVAYGLENPEFRDVPVTFTVTRAGRIINAVPVTDGKS